MLVTLEGLDGSGKTTCMDALGSADFLPEETVFTREPTHSWYGEAVRRSINDDEADSLAELFLYTADHADHVANTVEPALSAGTPVISDRYSDSRYAYQGVTLTDRFEDAMAFVREIHEPWTRSPDATLYLDIDPETAAERSGATNKFETVNHLEAVQENYERLIATEPERFVRIDASRPEAEVAADVLDAVETLL
ncbi:dTMP kinase [Halovenus salina]|uniref:Probable thymidylate kinase n=1 Tax=Halovenus salina TaxID=1510225 RepID=A0ABD5VYZ1_9EURY|nr:dTMP kinase [Halovenus salina]